MKQASSSTKALSIKLEGIVQRVGFRRFVEKDAWNLKLSGYVENLKDGSVRIFVQGSQSSLDEFMSRIKNAPPPIVIEKLESKKVRSIPTIRSFNIKTGPMALEIQEGFGAMETQFGDYRVEFKDFKNEFRDYRSEFGDYRNDFNQFANRTDENFKSLDTKYGEISDKLPHILETLEKESIETRKELTRAVDSLVAVVQKSLAVKD